MPQIHLNGARHYYRLEGDTSLPAIALVHPIGADLGLWDKVAPLLTGRFCVLRHDLRGHGGSEATTGEYTLDMLAKDLLDLTAALGLQKFTACGVSLGGMTSLHAAVLAPERITALVVCSAPPKLNPPPGGWDGRGKQALDTGMTPLAAPMVERMFSAAFRGTGDASVATLRTTFTNMDPAGYASACAVLRDTDLTAELAKVQVPTLIINGEGDVLVPVQTGKDMAAGIAGAKHLALPCGHFPPLEAAQAFADAVSAFASA